jgi:hypothetical protein
MRNARASGASELPQLVGSVPDRGRRPPTRTRCNAFARATKETPMEPLRPDPNAELHARERLRIVFALGSLLLGLLAAAHF